MLFRPQFPGALHLPGMGAVLFVSVYGHVTVVLSVGWEPVTDYRDSGLLGPVLPPTCSSGPVCTVPQPWPLPLYPPSALLHQGFSLCNSSPCALLWDGQTLSLWVHCVPVGAHVYPDSFLCQELGSSFCLPARAASQ